MRLLATLLLSAPLFGQPPDLSGVWKRADGGYSATCTIEQHEAVLKITEESKSTGGRLSSGMYYSNSYSVDGVERAGRDTWTTVNWQGPELVVLRVARNGYRVTVTRVSWAVSPDGRTLTRSRRTIDMDGVRENREQFEKQ